MFTGIIEEVGHVRSIMQNRDSAKLSINAGSVLRGTHRGDSIAVNGVCLTVTEIQADHFTSDVMAETLRRTNIGQLRSRDPVNLERALGLTSRLGGHLVSGHIDGTGMIKSIQNEGIASIMEIEGGADLLNYMAVKGSVALDGISLTVCAVSNSSFSVSLIPHTRLYTNLSDKKVGDAINIECDLIARYVEKLLSSRIPGSTASPRKGISVELLKNTGFIGGNL